MPRFARSLEGTVAASLRSLRVVLAATAVAVVVTGAVGAQAAETPRVVATIPPLHALVSGIMSGVGEPLLLVPYGVDPTEYQVTAEDREKLEDADLVVRLGDSFDAHLTGPIAQPEVQPNVLTLADAPGVTPVSGQDQEEGAPGPQARAPQVQVPQVDVPGSQGAQVQAQQGRAAPEQEPWEPGEGGAMWLDPANARVWVPLIAETLAEIDQDNAQAYSANAEGMIARLDALQTEIARLMAPAEGQTIIAFGDTFLPFERRFGLDIERGGDIHEQPEAQINPPPTGALPRAEIRARPQDTGPVCVLTTGRDDQQTAERMAQQQGGRVARVDVLSGGRDEGAGGYYGLLRDVARTIATCEDVQPGIAEGQAAEGVADSPAALSPSPDSPMNAETPTGAEGR